MEKEYKGPPRIVSSAAGRQFFQLDIFNCPRNVFLNALLPGGPYHLITMDPCWVTKLAADGCYSRLEDQDMIQLFRERIKPLFTPVGGPNAPNGAGYIFVWYVHGKEKLAIQCLYEAGYELIGNDTWTKTTKSGKDWKMSPMHGTAEKFYVGRKTRAGLRRIEQDPKLWEKYDDPSRGGPRLYTSYGFSARPFNREHSSKPEKFYTYYLPNYLHMRRAPLSFKRMNKLDLFTREIQPGFTSVGLQFNGVRVSDSFLTCEGCHENIYTDDGIEATLLCQASVCSRAWHEQCLTKHHPAHPFLPTAKSSAHFWLCPGCVSGDMEPRLLLSAGHQKKKQNKKSKWRVVEKKKTFKRQRQVEQATQAVLVNLSTKRNRRSSKVGQVIQVSNGGQGGWPARVISMDAKRGYYVQWLEPKRGYAEYEYIGADKIC